MRVTVCGAEGWIRRSVPGRSVTSQSPSGRNAMSQGIWRRSTTVDWIRPHRSRGVRARSRTASVGQWDRQAWTRSRRQKDDGPRTAAVGHERSSSYLLSIRDGRPRHVENQNARRRFGSGVTGEMALPGSRAWSWHLRFPEGSVGQSSMAPGSMGYLRDLAVLDEHGIAPGAVAS